jgi:hypothetical protein
MILSALIIVVVGQFCFSLAKIFTVARGEYLDFLIWERLLYIELFLATALPVLIICHFVCNTVEKIRQ